MPKKRMVRLREMLVAIVWWDYVVKRGVLLFPLSTTVPDPVCALLCSLGGFNLWHHPAFLSFWFVIWFSQWELVIENQKGKKKNESNSSYLPSNISTFVLEIIACLSCYVQEINHHTPAAALKSS